MKLIKIISLALVVIMVASFAVACAGNNETPTTTTTTQKQETPTTTTTTEKKEDKPAPSDDGETFEVAAGEPDVRYLDLSNYGDVITIKFKFAQNGTTSGGAGHAAALFAIDKKAALRVTGGGATHVMDINGKAIEATEGQTNWWGYKGEEYPDTLAIAEFVITVSEQKIDYKIGYDLNEPKIVGSVVSDYEFDPATGIKLTFGASQGADITIKDLTIK